MARVEPRSALSAASPPVRGALIAFMVATSIDDRHEGEPPLRAVDEGSPPDWRPLPLGADWGAREDTNTALGHRTLPPFAPLGR